MPNLPYNSRAFISIVGLVLLALLTAIMYASLPASEPTEVFWQSFLIICLGACIGALLGALASPFQSSEKDTFKLVAGIASAFLTGFLWKAFEGDIRTIIQSGNSSSVAGARLLAFAVAIFLSAFVNYAFRAYGSPAKSVDKQLKEVRSALDELEKAISHRSGEA